MVVSDFNAVFLLIVTVRAMASQTPACSSKNIVGIQKVGAYSVYNAVKDTSFGAGEKYMTALFI